MCCCCCCSGIDGIAGGDSVDAGSCTGLVLVDGPVDGLITVRLRALDMGFSTVNPFLVLLGVVEGLLGPAQSLVVGSAMFCD